MSKTKEVVVLQVLRDGEWREFAVGSQERVEQHVELNTPGQWRGITAEGEVIVPPRS